MVRCTPLLLATVLYLWNAYEFWDKLRPGIALVWVFYACANVGYIIDLLRE